MSSLEEKLKQLREDWKKYPDKRKIIELQAKLLKIGSTKNRVATPEDAERIFNEK